MAGQGNGDDVAFSLLEFLNHLGSILAFLHSQRHTNLLGKLLAEQVLQTHSVVVVIIIGGRTIHGEHDQLAIVLDIRQRQPPLLSLSTGIAICCVFVRFLFVRTIHSLHFAHGSSPGSEFLLRFLVSATGKQKQRI